MHNFHSTRLHCPWVPRCTNLPAQNRGRQQWWHAYAPGCLWNHHSCLESS
ncbi:hypothetical protein BS78_05G189700 [Paspalum vaginatum]|nr:hypothetical protein BS78_05G189700 [Paspalum vaginatum]